LETEERRALAIDIRRRLVNEQGHISDAAELTEEHRREMRQNVTWIERLFSDLLAAHRDERDEAAAAAAKVARMKASGYDDDHDGEGRVRCHHCGIPFRGQYALEEHVYRSHDGPIPQHVLRAEVLAGFTPIGKNGREMRQIDGMWVEDDLDEADEPVADVR